MPNPRNQDPMEIVAEVRQLRQDVEQRVARIYELSDALYTSVRHGTLRLERQRIEADIQLLQTRLERAVRHEESPEARRTLQAAIDGAQHQLNNHQETLPVYQAFANTWKRFAGSMHQGLKRTASIDRVIEQVQRKQGLTEPKRPDTPASPTPQATAEIVDDLVELYGEETVNHASS